jgi:anti-sigma factor RsiW
MTHATEGLLQAYLDEEISSSAAAELRDHLAGCAACERELLTLRAADERVRASLALLAADEPPVLRARAAIAAHRRSPARPRRSLARFGTGSLAKAAMLLLALAGAGAAAIPGSPIRRALETTFARVAQLFNGAAPPAPDTALPLEPAADPAIIDAVSSRMGVMPADGRVRVLLHAPAGPVHVHVRISDDPMAHVEAVTGDAVRFRTGSGRIEVAGLTSGTVTIEIPRNAHGATVEVDGLVYVYKQGEILRSSGPGGRGQGDQVRFQLGT